MTNLELFLSIANGLGGTLTAFLIRYFQSNQKKLIETSERLGDLESKISLLERSLSEKSTLNEQLMRQNNELDKKIALLELKIDMMNKSFVELKEILIKSKN